MTRRLAAAFTVALATACVPSREPLPQDQFLADGVLLTVPPPPGMRRLARGEGIPISHPRELPLANFQGEPGAYAIASLPGQIPRDPERHRERLEILRESWRGRWLESPDSIERESRARLAALRTGNVDSADWQPVVQGRMAVVAVDLDPPDAILRANAAEGSSVPGTRWQVDGFILVRGRVVHLYCVDLRGGSLRQLDAMRATTAAWIARVREANRAGARRGRVRRG